MIQNVFKTLKEAKEAEKKDAIKSGHERWSLIRMTKLGQYIYTPFKDSDFKHNTIEIDPLDIDEEFIDAVEDIETQVIHQKITNHEKKKWFISYTVACPPQSIGL